MAENKKKPNPVDAYVGSRVRLRRTTLGMSQEKLGECLGITFQQIQKYEKGSNRIGASRLKHISEVLDTPVSYFYEGAPNIGAARASGMEEAPGQDYIVDFLHTTESIQLTQAFMNIKDQKVRRRLIDLVRALASNDVEERL